MEIKKFVSVLFLLLLSRSALAASLFLEGGLHFGGDTIATLVFVGGETETIKAGELLSASIGLIGDVSDDLEARASIGIKMDIVFAQNGDADFTRLPLEFMLFNKGESVSFGLGLSYHLGPKFSASGTFAGGNTYINFEDALGVVAEVDYMLGEERKGYLGIKATFIDYETENIGFGTATISGNSVGVVIGVRF